MLITTPEGNALGYISHALENSAFAKRFGGAGQKINVVIYASSTVHALLVGEGGGSMNTTLPRDVAINIGDPVMLQTFESHPLGTVVDIEVTPEDAFQTVWVRAPQNIYDTRYVLIDTTHTWQPDSTPPEETGHD